MSKRILLYTKRDKRNGRKVLRIFIQFWWAYIINIIKSDILYKTYNSSRFKNNNSKLRYKTNIKNVIIYQIKKKKKFYIFPQYFLAWEGIVKRAFRAGIRDAFIGEAYRTAESLTAS